MGGGSRPIIGYKRYLGAQFVLCKGPIDKVLAVKFQDKIAWAGQVMDEILTIHQPDLLGGVEKEGGVSGYISILNGGASQVEEDYLQSQMGSAISAFRGVVSAVFRRVYIGNNPFLKPVSFKASNVFSYADGWYPEKAPVNPSYEGVEPWIYIAIDNSASMYPTRIAALKTAVKAFIEEFRDRQVNFSLVAFSGGVDSSIERIDCDGADLDELKAWVDGLTAGALTAYAPPIDLANAVIGNNGNTAFVPLNFDYPTFYPRSYPTANYNGFTINSTSYGDLTQNRNTASGEMYFDFDISSIPAGTTVNFSDILTVTGTAPIAWPLADKIYVYALSQANVDDELYNNGAEILEYTMSPSSFTGPASVSRSFSVVIPSGRVALRFMVQIASSAWYPSAANYIQGSQSKPVIEFEGLLEQTNFQAGVSLSGAFFDQAPTPGAPVKNEMTSAAFLASTIEDSDTHRGASDKALFFVTDGLPNPVDSATTAAATVAALDDVAVHAFNIEEPDTTYTEMLDNTPLDGVPVVASGDQISGYLGSSFASFIDINPAHFLRGLHVSASNNGSGDTAEIDDESFRAAADQLFSEGFGISLHDFKTTDRKQVKQEVEETIDGYTYHDRATGKIKIKLIRNDYEVGSLFVVDQSRIVRWADHVLPLQEDLPTTVTLTYTKREDGSEASMTLHNIAAIQSLGQVIPEKRPYPYITWDSLAAKVLERDLVARTSPIRTGTVVVNYAPDDLNLGSAFILTDPRMGIDGEVCRVTEIDFGNGFANDITIRFAADRFSLGEGGLVEVEPREPPDLRALPPSLRFVEEMPYYLAVYEAGQKEIDEQLALDDGYGRIMATCDQPNNRHIDAVIAVESGGEWVSAGASQFLTTTTLLADVAKDPTATTLSIALNSGLYRIEAGELCSIGDEIMRVDNLTTDGITATLTVGRGCLDTVPIAHLTGANVLFWRSAYGIADQSFTFGQTVNVRMLPRTSTSALAPSSATTDAVAMGRRMYRPYPPGNLKIEGSYADNQQFSASATATWAHRDRTMQTTTTIEDFTATDIGPEAGVTYDVTVTDHDAAGDVISTLVSTNVGTATTYTYTTPAPSATAETIRIAVKAVRGGLESWQTPYLTMTTVPAAAIRGTDGQPLRDTAGNFRLDTTG